MNKIKMIALVGILAIGSLALGEKITHPLLNPKLSWFQKMQFRFNKKKNLQELDEAQKALNELPEKLKPLVDLQEKRWKAYQNCEKNKKKLNKAEAKMNNYGRPSWTNFLPRAFLLMYHGGLCSTLKENNLDKQLSEADRKVLANEKMIAKEIDRTLKIITKNTHYIDPEAVGQAFSPFNNEHGKTKYYRIPMQKEPVFFIEENLLIKLVIRQNYKNCCNKHSDKNTNAIYEKIAKEIPHYLKEYPFKKLYLTTPGSYTNMYRYGHPFPYKEENCDI